MAWLSPPLAAPENPAALRQSIESAEAALKTARQRERDQAREVTQAEQRWNKARTSQHEKELRREQEEHRQARQRITALEKELDSLRERLRIALQPPPPPPVAKAPPPKPAAKLPPPPPVPYGQTQYAKPPPPIVKPAPVAAKPEAPALPPLPEIQAWPRIDFTSTELEVAGIFRARQMIVAQRRLLALMQSQGQKPEPQFKVERMIVAGVAQDGRPLRPLAIDQPVMLTRRATYVYAAALAPHAESPVLQRDPAGELPRILELRLNRPFYPQGFPGVGVIALGDEVICSATLIHPNWILTAAHCVLERQADGTFRFFDNEQARLGFYLASSSPSGPYAIDVPGRAVLHRAAARQVVLTHWFVRASWQGGNAEDVALLRIAPQDGLPVSPTDAPSITATALAERSDVTIAAYSHVTGAAGASSGTLEVGWHQVDFAAGESAFFSWEYAGEGTASSVCPMASGAPIYRGMQQGYADEKHELVGIVSLRRPRAASAAQWQRSDACRVGEALLLRLDTPEMRGWLCETTGRALNGCL